MQETEFPSGGRGGRAPSFYVIGTATQRWNPGRALRGVGERYKEQIAEDIVWDIIDEVDFFMQDGGFEGQVGSGTARDGGVSEKSSRLKSEEQ